MHPWTLWPEDPIFIEIGVRDADLALSLREDDYTRYLGVGSDAARIERLKSEHPQLADCLTCSNRRKLVLNNNADVLVLRGAHTRSLWKYDTVRHADWVVWPCAFGLASLVGLVGCLLHLVIGRFSWPRIVTFCTPQGKARRMFATRVRRPKNCRRNALHFIPHCLGLTGMFRQFDERDVRYAVLRWFERLPEIEPDEDVDMLVADDSLADVLDILHAQPGIQPCDIYSESGLARSAYCGTPYYPPEVARRMLKNSRVHRGFCRVPSESDYFHSLAYHAVYHKGRKSNLPGSENYRTAKRSSRDFKSLLPKMAAALGIDVEISLKGLHAYLQQRQWSPPPDWIARLATSAPHDRWLAELAASQSGHPTMDRGFTVFVIRQSAIDAGVHEKIISMVECHGFVPLARKALTQDEIQHGARRTRDGNWGPGPRDHIGGGPAIILATYDPQPLQPSRAQLKRWPQLTNARTLVKEEIRQQINQEIAPRHPINGVHCSDYGGESHHFLHTFAPELVAVVEEKIATLRGQAVDRRKAA